jgi:hypothetical protein
LRSHLPQVSKRQCWNLSFQFSVQYSDFILFSCFHSTDKFLTIRGFHFTSVLFAVYRRSDGLWSRIRE